MAVDEDERIYIVWNDSRRAATDNARDVYLARSTDLGGSFDEEVQVNHVDIPYDIDYPYPAVTASGHGHIAVSWEDKRNGGWNIYLTRSDDAGIAFRPSWMVSGAGKGSRSVADIIMGPQGYVYCIWRDEKGGDFDIYFASDESTTGLIEPNGGEILHPGQSFTIQWGSLPQVERFNLQYSLNNGGKWVTIASNVTGTSYVWQVPYPSDNQSRCRVKVTGLNSQGKKVGESRSDSPFTIEVVALTTPNGGETLTSRNTQKIQWETHGTKNPVASVKLYYTTGSKWSLIRTLSGNPGSYDWNVPSVPEAKHKCRVRVLLLDGKGKTVGSVVSDADFTIQ